MSRRSRKAFENDLEKGDILISTNTKGGASALIGHAAIMATDDWVLEMPGENNEGSSSSSFSTSLSFSPLSFLRLGREGNNRRISKQKWYTAHLSDDIKVYRCPDSDIAEMAADWAYTHYYNPSGGDEKTIHINYSVASPNFMVTNPSYCSKLVLQSYYFGTGPAGVINPMVLIPVGVIVPTTIPSYFTSSYQLSFVGLY